MKNKSHKILVVIPDKHLRELVGEVISMLKHQPILISDGEKAIAQYTNDNSIAVVLIDWEMTMKFFPDFIKKMKSISSYLGKFVLIDMEYGEIKRHINAGDFCCFMKKPFQLEKFESGILGCIEEYELSIKKCACP
ncbi:MAG: hypothetical protein VW455_04310 [Nitrospinota bacterium]